MTLYEIDNSIIEKNIKEMSKNVLLSSKANIGIIKFDRSKSLLIGFNESKEEFKIYKTRILELAESISYDYTELQHIFDKRYIAEALHILYGLGYHKFKCYYRAGFPLILIANEYSYEKSGIYEIGILIGPKHNL